MKYKVSFVVEVENHIQASPEHRQDVLAESMYLAIDEFKRHAYDSYDLPIYHADPLIIDVQEVKS
jgi:hypothetical protein